MISIILFSEAGVEEAVLPEGQLDATLGVNLMGEPAIAYRSGWLYALNGYTFSMQGQILPTPLDASAPLSITLLGKGRQAAIAIRPVAEGQRSISLSDVASFSVGHASANDLVYKDVLVSQCHGRFSREGTGGFVYTDMSTNGSFVNGWYLHNARVPLGDGAEVLIPPSLKLRILGDTLTMNWPAGMTHSRLTNPEEEST